MVKISDKIRANNGQPFFSFEYFPPKTPSGVQNLYERVERMGKLEPLFVDITWGAGGSTSDLTLELSSNFQQQFCLETQMHLTCTNIKKESVTDALVKCRKAGIQNILCLRGDPPHGQEKWTVTEGGFANAVDLVKYVRQEHGNYFGISVAGYPEGHIDWFKDSAEISEESYRKDLQYLKDKCDAGADCIVTQLFYDVDNFFKWVKDCRDIGITVPIIPGIMPINTYAGWERMTGLCKTKIPPAMREALEAIKDNDEAVKAFGVQFVTDMCRRLLEHGSPGLHIYTLNLEKSVIEILRNLNMPKDSIARRALPWRPRLVEGRCQEEVRPIYWANRPRSYLSRTLHWDDFPNGRWGDNRSPAFGELSDYHLCELHTVEVDERRRQWGAELASERDVREVFALYVEGAKNRLPWCARLDDETAPLQADLAQMNRNGLLTINSQPRVNGAPSADPTHGWGGAGGYVYQKAYVEFFCPPGHLAALRAALAARPTLQHTAVNARGELEASSPHKVMAVTWGVFPDREVVQPTVMDQDSFLVWKDEAFGLWASQWRVLYPEGSPSAAVIDKIRESYYLVTVVDNDYMGGDLFAFLNAATAVRPAPPPPPAHAGE